MPTILASCLVCLSLAAGAADESLVLRSGRLSLTLDAQTGDWSETRWDDRSLGSAPLQRAPLDIKQDADWLVGGKRTPLKLRSLKRESPTAATATLDIGDWTVAVRYALDAERPLLTRSARLTWKGRAATKLKGFWLGAPPMTLQKDGGYFFPGVYPPARRQAAELQEGSARSTHQSLAPLVVQLTSRLSALWISDELTPASDRASATVREHADSVETSQAFAAQGHVRPGDSQDIGAACLWLVDGDGEAALRRIHAWMRLRAHVAPADRPDWFRDAAIYSFHPGGTIGSNFRDLGGFHAATGLLDQIVALGLNTIWIMPIEDASVYHPRDYYRFQEGLGTADEYRALVRRAHQLRLRVLQDLVPHGGRNDYPRAKEHPEWLAYEEDGSTLSYWCYDFNWPAWRDYIAGVARHYVTQFGVDGYRVDAVGGSRIPNWSAKIPYARASFAQLQGGLNMLRSIRGAVQGAKPRAGAVLAEVQGSVYGTAADAVYDFTGCYQAFHDLRKLPAPAFVARLRRWLHEQQYAETPDLLRLRHIESHDSLRAQLWYGAAPMRAMLAMSAWIDGIPLVYHEMENGHEDAIKRIFAVRDALPELRRGVPDYLSAEAPEGVFAWIRNDGTGASIACVNFASTFAEGELRVPLAALPAALRTAPQVTQVCHSGLTGCNPTEVQAGVLRVPIVAAPFAYGVCAIRLARVATTYDPGANRGLAANPAPSPAAPRDAIMLRAPAEFSTVSWRAWIDSQTGLLEQFQAKGQGMLGPADLYLPSDYRASAGKASVRRERDNVIAERTYGPARLELRYEPCATGLGVFARWLGDKRPAAASLYLPFPAAAGWMARTAEGSLQGVFRGRHLTTAGVLGSIYWRPQGTNVIWDSLFQPLGAEASVSALGDGFPLQLSFPSGQPPARVQWLDRIADRPQLGALLSWCDPAAPQGSASAALAFQIGDPPSRPEVSPASRFLRPAAGGWEYENDAYRLRLSRSGMITQLWSKSETAEPRLVVDQSDLYTDHGFAADRTRYGALNDVEAAVRIDQQGSRMRLRCEGQLRGFGRFDLLRPPVDYFCEYVLDDTASFRLSWGVRPQTAPGQPSAFVGWMLPVPELTRFAFRREGAALAEGPAGKSKGRLGQTRSLSPARLPDVVELANAQTTLLRLTDLESGPAALPNVFVDGHNVFVAFYDGAENAGGEGQWRWASAMWTVGAAPVSRFSAAPQIEAAPHTPLLADSGFERTAANQSVSLRTGRPLPGASRPSAWTTPPGGTLTSTPVHSGSVAAAVENSDGGYRLWQQALPAGRFAPGSRWRLSAWLKGEAVKPGDVSWKVGVLRFAVTADKTHYASSGPLKGDFDWRQVQVELTVPPGLRSLRVEAGLNGATGRMWIDDLQLEELR